MKNTDLVFDKRYPLSKKDFSPEKMHEIIFIAIVKLAEQGTKVVSEIEIDNYVQNYPASYEILQDGDFMGFVDIVKELSNIENYELYYKTTRKFSLLRDLKSAGFDIEDYFDESLDESDQQANFDRYTIEDILNDIEYKSTKLRGKYDVHYAREEMLAGDNTEELLELFKQKPAFGASLSSPYLTTLYQGWCRSHLLLRSANSGLGKSKMAVGELCNVCSKEIWNSEAEDFIPNPNYQGPGFFIHTEQLMYTEINPMFLSCIAEVEYRNLRNGLLTPAEEKRVLKAGEILRESNIFLVDMPDFTSLSLKRKIKELVEGEGITYGVFDYVQLQSPLASEYKQFSNMPPREDLVLKSLVTDLKAYAEEFNIGILSMTQLNDNWRNSTFPDEGCLSGAKSMKNKLDAGSIVLSTKERLKEFKRVEPFVKKVGFGTANQILPNIIEYIYKNRYGTFGDQKIKVWSYLNRGTCRRTDFFCTDANDQIVGVEKTLISQGDFE